jgi:glutathione S-transferase
LLTTLNYRSSTTITHNYRPSPRATRQVTGTPYNSVMHYSGEPGWRDYAPFGQLPILRDGALVLCESDAISRHLARRCMIDGASMEEKAKVDMYAELAKDIKGKKNAIYDMEKHADAPKLKTFLDAAEAVAPDPHAGGWFVGKSLTLADVTLFQQLHFMEEVKPGALEQSGYTKLSAFVRNFAQMPNVAAYLESPRRVPLSYNELGDRPNAGLPGYAFTKPLRVATYMTPWSGP